MGKSREAALRLFSAIGKIYPHKVGWRVYTRLVLYTDDSTELDLMLREFGGRAGKHLNQKYWTLSKSPAVHNFLTEFVAYNASDSRRLLLATWALLLHNSYSWQERIQVYKEMKRLTSSPVTQPDAGSRLASYLDDKALGASSIAPLPQLAQAQSPEQLSGNESEQVEGRPGASETSQTKTPEQRQRPQ